MDFEHKVYLARAQNELSLSVMIQKISDDKKMHNAKVFFNNIFRLCENKSGRK